MFRKNFVEYAILLLFKDRNDHLFSFLIFSFIVFILSAVLFISDSLQYDLIRSINAQPSIVVENTRVGRAYPMHEGHVYDVSQMTGVSSVEGVVDGYHYFAQKRLWFHIIGDPSLAKDEMLIGQGVTKSDGRAVLRRGISFPHRRAPHQSQNQQNRSQRDEHSLQ